MENKKCDICNSDFIVRFHKKAKQYFCNKHRLQFNRHGEIRNRTIYDKNDFVICDNYAEMILYDKNGNEDGRTKIDISKIELLKQFKWHLKKDKIYDKSYVTSIIEHKNIRLHRFLLDINEPHIIVDHIDRNTLNNQISNLRICTTQENRYNADINKRNKSGITGVWWHSQSNKWCAEIWVNKKKIYLGIFEDKEEAIKIRKEAEEKYFGEFAPK